MYTIPHFLLPIVILGLEWVEIKLDNNDDDDNDDDDNDWWQVNSRPASRVMKSFSVDEVNPNMTVTAHVKFVSSSGRHWETEEKDRDGDRDERRPDLHDPGGGPGHRLLPHVSRHRRRFRWVLVQYPGITPDPSSI